ncbi:MAG: hypothetical protein MO852_09730, partial [Candidatus Devosia euplotis]|nr:hypothetical protein [Candidatus Devosia euplotis]
QSQIVAMLHEREVEMGLLCWFNIDPLAVDLVPLLVMRERVPLVVSPDIAPGYRQSRASRTCWRRCRG